MSSFRLGGGLITGDLVRRDPHYDAFVLNVAPWPGVALGPSHHKLFRAQCVILHSDGSISVSPREWPYDIPIDAVKDD